MDAGSWNPAYTIRPDSGCWLTVMTMTGRDQNLSESDAKAVAFFPLQWIDATDLTQRLVQFSTTSIDLEKPMITPSVPSLRSVPNELLPLKQFQCLTDDGSLSSIEG